MGKVQRKKITSVSYTPLSEPYRFLYVLGFSIKQILQL